MKKPFATACLIIASIVCTAQAAPLLSKNLPTELNVSGLVKTLRYNAERLYEIDALDGVKGNADRGWQQFVGRDESCDVDTVESTLMTTSSASAARKIINTIESIIKKNYQGKTAVSDIPKGLRIYSAKYKGRWIYASIVGSQGDSEFVLNTCVMR